MKISLRGRLTFWYLLAIPVVIFALVFTAQRVMVTNLRKDFDADLMERAEIVAAAIRSDPEAAPEKYEDILERLIENQFLSIPLFLRIGDLEGNVITTFGDIPKATVPILDQQLSQSRSSERRFENIEIRRVEALRVHTLTVRALTTLEPLALVQTGESLAPVAAARDRLLLYTIVEGVGGSLLTLLVGMFILYRGLRPLDRILGRVRDIQTQSLLVGLPQEPRPPELQELANSLNDMWRRLDLAFRAKQTFVANVSHDLRTPLTALQGQIDVLLMQPTLNEEARDSLERMSKEVRRLVRMTNNLLLNAQLEAAPALTREAVNLRKLLEDVIAEIWVLAEHLEVTLEAPMDVEVAGDYDLLKQMVLNLVDNAIKFTPRGGRVALALMLQETEAVLEVSDSGRGIPQEHLSRVMEPFYKVDGPRGATGGGAGLGLAIVKQIVELHGGQVVIHSREGVGTSVSVGLPAQAALGRLQDKARVSGMTI